MTWSSSELFHVTFIVAPGFPTHQEGQWKYLTSCPLHILYEDDEGGFNAVLHGKHEFIGGQCMDTDDGEEEAVEEDAGDEWDDGRCGQDEYRGMQVACDDQEEE